MNCANRRQRFRNILSGTVCVSPATVFDPVSARIAEELGFETGILPGSVAALSVLAGPDLTLITLTEFAEQILRVCRVSELPLLVDADHGYGNALNVMRTVRELEIAGVAALTIEDTLLPPAFGHASETQLISVEEGVGKLRAALAARQDPGLSIVGRTGAAAVAGIDELVSRVKSYEATGIDALFLSGMKTRNELEAVASSVRIPIILGLATPDLADRTYLAARGVRLNHQGQQSYQASICAIYATLKALRAGESPAEDNKAEMAELMKKVTKQADYTASTKAFLGPVLN